MPLPVNRSSSNTVQEHVDDHNALHGFFNGSPGTDAVAYVTSGGDDSNTGGSWSDALATLDAAVAALPAGGGTVHMAAGTYNGRFAIDKDHVTVIGAGRGPSGTVLRLPDNTDVEAQVLTITGDHVTVRNLRVDGNQANNADQTTGLSDGIAIYANHAWIDRCFITGPRAHGIITWDTATTSASNASATAGSRKGTVITFCHVENTGNPSDGRSAIDFASGGDVTEWVVYGCVIDMNDAENDTDAFTVHSAGRGLILGNKFYGLGPSVASLYIHSGAYDIKVVNNLFVSSQSNRCILVTSGEKILFDGNYFVGEDPASGHRFNIAITLQGTWDLIKVVNNFHLDETAAGTNPSLVAVSSYSSGQRLDVMGNTLVHPSGTGGAIIANSSGTDLEPDDILIRDNRCAGTDSIMTGGGTVDAFGVRGSVISDGKGSDTQSGDGSTTAFTIAHGLSAAPSVYSVQPASADAAGDSHVTADSSNLTITYGTAPASGTDNLTWVWAAQV